MGQVQSLLGGFNCCLHEELPCWSSWDTWSPVAMLCHAIPCPPLQFSKT